MPTFIANMGGMLGFAMGFSVVCAVEVVYCLLIRDGAGGRSQREKGKIPINNLGYFIKQT